MEHKNSLIEKRHIICPYECDKNGNLRIITLMNLLQDISQKHISLLGFGVDVYAKKSLIWVAAKYDIRIINPPKSEAEITILTWLSEVGKYVAIREFEIRDCEGNVIVEAVSKWALVSKITKRVAPLPEAPLYNKKLFNMALPKAKLETIDFSKEYQVMYDAIDFNQHVNNSCYSLWALETVPFDFRLKKQPKEIKISFKREALLGDVIFVETENADEFTHHKITSKNSGTELADVTIKWINTPALTS